LTVLLLIGPLAGAQTTQQTVAANPPASQSAASIAVKPHPTAVQQQPSLRPRVLIISVDGLRPDLLLRAKTPYIHELFEGGSYTFWARTVPHAITLPSHVSMLTGVPPRRHGIEWNVDLPLIEPVYPKVPTLFAVAKKAGYTTALVAGKMKFSTMAVPGTLDWQFIPDTEKAEDADVAARAIQIISSHRPQVMAVHLPTVDNVGHAVGWATPQQLAAIEQADGHVGAILAALRATNLRESTTVILTADHGGAGRTHMADDVRARHIP
jgi:predicted AlkP superfamily pyrophosphatase or phosphodiesterase